MPLDNKPLVTVITVTYNSEKYVRDAVESVLAQSYANIEYIIGDDCSIDNTWEIINEYQDPRIKAYRNDVNLREYPNRNKAINLATGEYLIFIDGDDVIYPHSVDFFVNMMTAFPTAGMAIQKGYFNNILFPALLTSEQVILNRCYGNSLIISSFASNFFKTTVLRKIGGLKEQYKTGDEEIRFNIACHYPILFVAGWTSWPRETPGQASSQLKDYLGFIEYYRYTQAIFRDSETNLSIDLKRDILKSLNNRASKVLIRLLLKGKISKVIEYLTTVNLKWIDLIKNLHYKPAYKDSLLIFTPEKPYNSDLLMYFSR